MKLKGFTLAEVLVVLMVLGVIAMLTLPALNANIQKQQAGPALMRAISTLETANALVSNERDFYNFSESCSNYLNDCFKPFVKEKLGAAEFNENIEYPILGNSETPPVSYQNGFVTNNGFVYYVSSDSFSDTNPYIAIHIDINGIKKPNTVGKDLFVVNLHPDAEGSKLYALGSKAFVELVNSLNIVGRTDSWEDKCNSSQVIDGHVCAGSIVDNGGKVVYPW